MNYASNNKASLQNSKVHRVSEDTLLNVFSRLKEIDGNRNRLHRYVLQTDKTLFITFCFVTYEQNSF